jgi:hypothetical protein
MERDEIMSNPMKKPASPLNRQDPQNLQPQDPQKNPGQGQKTASPQNPAFKDQKPRDPSQREPNQQGNPQDRYASGTDRARDIPVDRKADQTRPDQARPGGSQDDDRGDKGKH